MATDIFYDISLDGHGDGSEEDPFTWDDAMDNENEYGWINPWGDTNFYIRGIRHLSSGDIHICESCAASCRLLPWDLEQYGPWRIGIDSGSITIFGYETPGYELNGAVLKATTVTIDSPYYSLPVYRTIVMADTIYLNINYYSPDSYVNYISGSSFIASNHIGFDGAPDPYTSRFMDCIFEFSTASISSSSYVDFFSCVMPAGLGGGHPSFSNCQTDWTSTEWPEWNDTNLAHWAQSLLSVGISTPPQPGTPPYSNYATGMAGEARTGIGFLYFDTPTTTTPAPELYHIEIHHSETNRPSSDLVASNVFDTTFESEAVNQLPSEMLAKDFNISEFIYSNYQINNEGSGETFWLDNSVVYGMKGLRRYGIGYFYFYIAVPNPDVVEPVESQDYTEELPTEIKFWDWLTTFWDFLTDKDREMFENYWLGMKLCGDSLLKKANRMMSASGPESSTEHLYEDYYELLVSPLVSKPINLDPTNQGENFIIRPISKLLIEPEYGEDMKPVYHDMIEISATDYYKIRSIGLGCYVVLRVNNQDVPDQFFKIYNLMSSEESQSSGRYYPPAGNIWQIDHYVPDKTKFKYMIVIEGDLSYIDDNSFIFYLTTGRAYDVDAWVVSLPVLHTHISTGFPIEFKNGRDYDLKEHIVEFNHNIFESKEVSVADILYCAKTPIIEHYLYDMFGKIVGIPDWLAYNHNNISGKAAINAALLSLQNISTVTDYCRALNVFYGLPVAPRNSKVIGLYESYAYEITDISEDHNTITISLPAGSSLHPFVQPGGRFMCEGKKDVIIDGVLDRDLGTVKLRDGSELSVGDSLFIKLRNKFILKDAVAETLEDASYVIIYSPEGHEAIQHLVDYINTTSGGKRYPEMLIYGTEKLAHNINGIYHITKSEPLPGSAQIVKLTLYKKAVSEEPLYNDFIGYNLFEDTAGNKHGVVHIPWPTHKFLYLLMEGNEYFKAYLDSPIDTVFDEEDSVIKYQVLARNVSVFTKNMFPNWDQFDHFKRYNGLSLESDVLEVTKSLPGALYGNYFPSGYIETK